MIYVGAGLIHGEVSLIRQLYPQAEQYLWPACLSADSLRVSEPEFTLELLEALRVLVSHS